MTEEIEVYEQHEAPVSAQVGGVFALEEPAEMIQKATAAANVLKDVVKKAGLVASIGGKEYLTVEAWTTLGVLVGCTARTEWSREIEGGYEAAVEVVNAHGLVIGRAEALCTRAERNWKNRDDYALKSMAQTRAMGKALRMPLGWIAVLAGYQATPAEEMPTAAQEPPGRGAAPQPAQEHRTDGKRPLEPAGSFKAWAEQMAALGVEDPNGWLKRAVAAYFNVESIAELSADGKRDALRMANDAMLALDLALQADPHAEAEINLGFVADERLAAVFGSAYGGIAL